jgi:membrane-associated protease RseP (regulator of RpoE activity)
MRLAALASMVVLAPGSPQGCNGGAPDTELEVHWSMPDGPGDRGVRVVGCMDWDLEAEGGTHGTSGVLEADAGWTRCALVGWRRDGQLLVLALDGESLVQDIAFDLPEGPIGGMGTRIEGSCHGMRIVEVVPGSPAAQAGIVAGDLVTTIDGIPTWPLSTGAFVRRATGPVGSAITVEVVRNGEPFEASMVRARIP